MPQLNGVLPGLVVDNNDPESRGRVQVRFAHHPSPGPFDRNSNVRRSDEERDELWARVATLMAGNNRGTWFMPDVGDEVLVAFDAGDPTSAYVIGALWSRRNQPPEFMQSGNDKKVLRSRNGLKITLNDVDGQEDLTLETPGGQKLVLSDGPGRIHIADANSNSVAFEAAGITVTATANVTVNAGTVRIRAGAITIDAGMTTFAGTIQCDTMISNSVVSASYTPGAGNVW
jgi:phage baseplate assembly protein V